MAEALCLVVDDEPAVRRLVTTVLDRAGFKTIEAENGTRALELIRNLGGAVDLLVSDIQMPNMDGITLARSIRAEFPAIRLILISGTFEPKDLRDTSFDFVPKPFRPATLLKAIQKTMVRADSR